MFDFIWLVIVLVAARINDPLMNVICIVVSDLLLVALLRLIMSMLLLNIT